MEKIKQHGAGIAGWATLLVVCGGFALLLSQGNQQAHAGPPQGTFAIAEATPAIPLISTQLGSFTVAVDSNVDGGTDAITSSNASVKGYASVYCETSSARPLYWGGATTAQETNAPCISTSSTVCPLPYFRAEVRDGLLGADIADGGTVTIRCNAGK